jgi:excisionase family DNA binding protein
MDRTPHALHTEWLDAKRFVSEYPFSQRTFWQWIAEGKLTPYRPSRRKTLVKRSEVEQIIEASKASADLDTVINETVAEVLRGGK